MTGRFKSFLFHSLVESLFLQKTLNQFVFGEFGQWWVNESHYWTSMRLLSALAVEKTGSAEKTDGLASWTKISFKKNGEKQAKRKLKILEKTISFLAFCRLLLQNVPKETVRCISRWYNEKFLKSRHSSFFFLRFCQLVPNLYMIVGSDVAVKLAENIDPVCDG